MTKAKTLLGCEDKAIQELSGNECTFHTLCLLAYLTLLMLQHNFYSPVHFVPLTACSLGMTVSGYESLKRRRSLCATLGHFPLVMFELNHLSKIQRGVTERTALTPTRNRIRPLCI